MSWYDDNEDRIIWGYDYRRHPRVGHGPGKTHYPDGCGVTVRLETDPNKVTCKGCLRILNGPETDRELLVPTR